MFILWGYITVLLTLLFYWALMNLKRHRDNLSPAAKFFAYQVLAMGFVLDVILNIVFGTIVFLDLPKELVLTHRLKRYKHRTDWRGRLGRWVCKNLLDQFDPSGTHC